MILRSSCKARAVHWFAVLFYGVGACIPCFSATDNAGIIDRPSVDGLRLQVESTNVVLTWPSNPRESFVVLWRSNATFQTPWLVLTNSLPASPTANETTFCDVGMLSRSPEMLTNASLDGFYRVFVVPDFWFDMEGVTLSGGATVPSEDFLPFYYGNDATDFFQPEVGLMVDGEEAGWGPIHIERVNFGTSQNPRWTYVAGFWFRHDLLADGEHTLQLRSTLELNNFVGTWSQSLVLSNKPVRTKVSAKSNHDSWWDQRLGYDFKVPRSAEEYGEKFVQEQRNRPEVKIPSRPLDLASSQIDFKSSGMILDLGTVSHYVKITPEYSNAVLMAVLPCFSDVARKLNLPVPQPITQADIDQFHVLPFREMTASVLLKNGCIFDFHFGFVNFYISPQSQSYRRPTSKNIPKETHQRIITKNQAVQMARDAIKKLGISSEDVFAEQKPRVMIEQRNTNTTPCYRVQWLDPRGFGQIIGEDNPETKNDGLVTAPAVDVEINAETKEVEEIHLALLESLRRSPPKIDVVPLPGRATYFSVPEHQVNPVYARQLLPIMFHAIDEYGQKLSLPIPHPLTTNNVAKIVVYDNGGWPHCEIELTNGWRFIYRHTMVNGYYAPDNFFDSDNRVIHIKEFEGKWSLTTNQAIEVVRQAMTKLNYPTNNVHMDFAPTVYTASVDREHIPRLRFEWYYSVQDELQSRLEAEVNAESGKLESLYYDDKVYWGSRPLIDVPISAKK